MAELVTFGEILLRLCPENNVRIDSADAFGAVYGGSEANVAVGYSCFKQAGSCKNSKAASFVSALPDNPVGHAAENSLRRYGVDTADIIFDRSECARLGLYYLENGASVRPSRVFYDRRGSSVTALSRDAIDWKRILSGAKYFHCSGITPALGGNLPEITLDALKTAKSMGVKTSCDLNYRAALWSEADAAAVMTPMLEYTDMLIANETQAGAVLGVSSDGNDEKARLSDIARKLCQRYSLSCAALTLRRTLSASDNVISAMRCDMPGGECLFSREYTLHIIDRVGGGDAFAAGLLFADCMKMNTSDALEFAVAASALKHTIHGDALTVSADEVEAAVKSGGSGRMVR